MNKIELLIIGAARSGTTTIYKHLEKHSQICFSSIKEIHYFSVDELFLRGNNYYHSFFKHYQNEKIISSADTYLFIDKHAPKRILNYNPKMKFIVMLRNPIDRAFSGYNYAINNGYLSADISFIESIKNEDNLLKKALKIEEINNLCNAYQSKYLEHLNYWFDFFPEKNFLILQTKELRDNLNSLLNKISSFLQIENFNSEIESIRVNKSSKVKSKKLQQFLLNRNTKGRKLIRKIIPNKLKQSFVKSGIVDKIYSANKTESEQNKITKNEMKWAEKYFQTEITNLKNKYKIIF